MPDWAPMSTPAWNPSSRTPQPAQGGDDLTPSGSSSSARRGPIEPQHKLFDSRLLGIRLKVRVNDEDKDTIAVVTLTEGRWSIRHPYHKTLEYLAPETVKAKNPHPTRDNGLLVVIEGEHTGKYVRRIHHRYDSFGNAVNTLAVVAKNAEGGADDRLTGEYLDLMTAFLCVANETPDEKKKAAILMKPLREQARVNRAK